MCDEAGIVEGQVVHGLQNSPVDCPQHCHNTMQGPFSLRQTSEHLLVSPRKPHRRMLAKSFILIFYGGTRPRPLRHLSCKSTARYINYCADR